MPPDYAIAAILSIYLEDGEIHPIAFLSQSLHNAELNYDTHDKELLAIFEAFKYWRHYLEGSADPIDVVTDYKNLEYFSTTKILTQTAGPVVRIPFPVQSSNPVPAGETRRETGRTH